MATFAKATFSAAGYAAFRPTYPAQVFKTILAYHQSPSNLVLDLGCGHGPLSRELSSSFTRVVGTDPSNAMITQARSSTPQSNISFHQASAEELDLLDDRSVDMVVAGQAAHWFDYTKLWPELAKKVRSGGTLAFVGYKDNIFPEFPKATKVFDHYCYGDDTMGPYWEQPGRNILRDKYEAIVPPEGDWEAVERITYEPGTAGKASGEGEPLMTKKLKVGEIESYARTFSSFCNWAAEHPELAAKKDGGPGDIVDEMFEEILKVEPEWRAKGEGWRDIEVENEWGSVILLARRR